MVRLLPLLVLALLPACGNPCQAICVDMAAYARECGCEVAGDEIQACQEAFAEPTEAQAQQCLTSSDPEQLREWWTCEDLLENYSSCAN